MKNLRWTEDYCGIICKGLPVSLLPKLRTAIDNKEAADVRRVDSFLKHYYFFNWQSCNFKITCAKTFSEDSAFLKVQAVELVEWCI